MSNRRSYTGLQMLMRKAGLSTSAAADPAPTDPADPAEDPEADPANPEADPADPAPADPAPADPADPANPEADPEDPEADPADPAEPKPETGANTASADYRAGVTATNGRWAAVFSSEHARNNLEMATDLLAETNMSASAIVGMCERHAAGGNPGKKLLEQTPRPNLGGAIGAAAGGQGTDEGKTARSKAADRVNARTRTGRGIKANAPVRRGGGSKQQEG